MVSAEYDLWVSLDICLLTDARTRSWGSYIPTLNVLGFLNKTLFYCKYFKLCRQVSREKNK